MRKLILPLLALGAMTLCVGTAYAATQVIIIKSKNISKYNEAITSFRQNLAVKPTEYDMQGSMERGVKIAEIINNAEPSLVLAVGSQAALVARDEVDSSIPVIFAMVVDPEKNALRTDNMTGIALDIPASEQLRALKSIVPKINRVGVIYNPKHSDAVIDEAREASGELGIKLIAAKVDSQADTPRALKAFSSGIDALWMIADPTVVNPSSFAAMMNFTQSTNTPFIVYTAAMVKEGALASLGPNNAAIGAQAARMAAQVLKGESPGKIPVETPAKLNLAINLDTAKQIGQECEVALQIFSYSARNQYAIEVFGNP